MAIAELSAAESLQNEKETRPMDIVWRRFSRHRLAVLGALVLLGLTLFSFVGPLVSPYDAEAQFLGEPNDVPSARFWLGTDELGRDVMTRLMWAGRISLMLSLVVTVGTIVVGIVLGALAGYFGGWFDTLAMRLVDFMLTLPVLPLLLLLSAMNLRGGLPVASPDSLNRFFGWVWDMTADRAENILILIFILILFGWMSTARLVRGQILSLKTMEFTEAARAIGATPWRIITRHMIPNAMAPIIVSATFSFGGVIITEAALSFVGFGVQPPSASWGSMLNGVKDFMMVQPWRAFVPGLTIFLASVSFNFVGDALRDALDPRLKL
jgi:peptide/nickel transport system permease protein